MHNPSNDLGPVSQPSFTSNSNFERLKQEIKPTHDKNSRLPGFDSKEKAKDDNARKLSIQDVRIVADKKNHNLFYGKSAVRTLGMPITWYQLNKEKFSIHNREIQKTEEDAKEEEDNLDNEDKKRTREKKENGAKDEVNEDDDVDYDENSSGNDNLHQEEKKAQEQKELNERIRGPTSEVVTDRKIKMVPGLKEIYNLQKGDRRLGRRCMEKIKKNRNIITVAVVAFSVGLYVSHKLKGNNQEAEAAAHICPIAIYMYFK